jgi:hypothetical protein
MRAGCGAILVASTVTAVAIAAAQARPPRRATIVEGVGMAGVKVGAKIALRRASPQRVTAGPMRAWGPVDGFCFEGSTCGWKVPGGGRVQAEIRAAGNRLTHLSTTSPAWRTRRGVHVGSPVAVARARYPGARREHTCAISPYGAELDALVLRTASRSTAFEIRGGRVAAIWVLAARVPAGARC